MGKKYIAQPRYHKVCRMCNEYGIPKNLVNSKKKHQTEFNGGQFFLQSKLLSHATNIPTFMETRGSLPSSQQPTTGYYLKPNKPSLPFRFPTTVL